MAESQEGDRRVPFGYAIDNKSEVDPEPCRVGWYSAFRLDAMRPRHWKAIMEEIGCEFDPHAGDFTLGKVARTSDGGYGMTLISGLRA